MSQKLELGDNCMRGYSKTGETDAWSYYVEILAGVQRF